MIFYEGLFSEEKKTVSRFVGDAAKNKKPFELLELYGEAAKDNS